MSQHRKVYVMHKKEGGTNYWKIGISNNPKNRLKTIQTGSHNTVRLHHVSDVCSNARDVESSLHRIYKKERLQGEWFSLTDVQVVQVVDYIHKKAKTPEHIRLARAAEKQRQQEEAQRQRHAKAEAEAAEKQGEARRRNEEVASLLAQEKHYDALANALAEKDVIRLTYLRIKGTTATKIEAQQYLQEQLNKLKEVPNARAAKAQAAEKEAGTSRAAEIKQQELERVEPYAKLKQSAKDGIKNLVPGFLRATLVLLLVGSFVALSEQIRYKDSQTNHKAEELKYPTMPDLDSLVPIDPAKVKFPAYDAAHVVGGRVTTPADEARYKASSKAYEVTKPEQKEAADSTYSAKLIAAGHTARSLEIKPARIDSPDDLVFIPKAVRQTQAASLQSAEQTRTQRPSQPAIQLSAPGAAIGLTTFETELTSRAISNDDLQLVSKQFDNLQHAIRERDINAVDNLTELSSARAQQFMQIFANSTEIDAHIKILSTRSVTEEILGILLINRIQRADGSAVKPPENMSSIALSSKRVGGAWSAIRW